MWMCPLPDDAQPTDILKVYVLTQDASSCFIDDIQAEAIEPKNSW